MTASDSVSGQIKARFCNSEGTNLPQLHELFDFLFKQDALLSIMFTDEILDGEIRRRIILSHLSNGFSQFKVWIWAIPYKQLASNPQKEACTSENHPLPGPALALQHFQTLISHFSHAFSPSKPIIFVLPCNCCNFSSTAPNCIQVQATPLSIILLHIENAKPHCSPSVVPANPAPLSPSGPRGSWGH